MDTSEGDLDADQKILDSVEASWKLSLDVSDVILEAIETFSMTIRDTMEDSKPKLAVPASKEDCWKKARTLHAVFERARESWTAIKTDYVKNLWSHYVHVEGLAFSCMNDYADKVGRETSRRIRGIGEEMTGHLDILCHKEMEITELCDDALETYEQTCLHEMMEGQEEDLKEWFDNQVVSVYGKHVKVAKHKNDGFQLDPTVSRPQPKRFVPPEIILLIYSFADLETCAVLREVSSQWYSIFHDIDVLWKSKMRERNPWMVPGDGDLETWQDVVLVFVKRLESGLWLKTDNIDSVELIGNNKPKKTVVGKELKFGEKLPSSFVSLTDSSGCDAKACEHMHVVSDNDEYLMNPWTLESQRYPEEYEVVSRDSEETIIRVKDVEITLPTFIFTQNILGEFSVRLYRSTVCFRMSGGGLLAMPRDRPHYMNAIPFLEPYTLFEVGDHFWEKKSGEFCLIDFSDRDMKEYYGCSFSFTAFPAASYNGLIWLQLPNQCLVPTFIDLKS